MLVPSSHRTTTVVARRQIWSAATSYIDLHIATPLSVDEVARAAITSRRHLQRVFADEGDTTVREYITHARMRQATALIVGSDDSLGVIAGAVGYGHVSAFIKAFRVHHGTTPIELRRRHRPTAHDAARARVIALALPHCGIRSGDAGAVAMAAPGGARGRGPSWSSR